MTANTGRDRDDHELLHRPEALQLTCGDLWSRLDSALRDEAEAAEANAISPSRETGVRLDRARRDRANACAQLIEHRCYYDKLALADLGLARPTLLDDS